MRFIKALRKSQARFKDLNTPKWEDCKTATDEEIDQFIKLLMPTK